MSAKGQELRLAAYITWCLALILVCYFNTEFSIRGLVTAFLAFRIFLHHDNWQMDDNILWKGCLNTDA
eukprot:2175274-Rhodomonas_salina.1